VPEALDPGVYIEEVGVGAHSIDGVATSAAGFIGEAVDGPVGQAVLTTSMVDFERDFGTLDPRRDLGYAVKQFFDNGGRRAWVVRADGPRQARDALAAFDAVDPAVNLVCLPGWVDEEILGAALTYCDERRAFLVVDPPDSDMRASMDLVARLGESGSANAAVYFPAIVMADPANGGRPRSCPPSGTVAGIIARTDMEQGVFVAPADVAVVGVTGLEVTVAEADAALLNEAGVNTIRSFPGRGIRVWGSRTVASPSSEWRYVPVRRLALFVEESLDRGLQWAVFEPNDEPLWIQVRQSVEGFLSGVWRSGGLQGSTEPQAFFVRCDRSLMTQDDLDKGRLIVLVGFAPVKPAEFVIIRITVQTNASGT
jgi:phage tail sheath protein FI